MAGIFPLGWKSQGRLSPRLIARRVLGGSLAITLLICVGIWLHRGDSSTVVPIFGFHRIIDRRAAGNRPLRWGASIVDYPRPQLEQFLEHLAKGRYWTLTADELYRYFIAQPYAAIPPEHAGEKPVALTFDDGYTSTDTTVRPILESLEHRTGRKLKVILFINSGNLGRREEALSYMSCEDLRRGFSDGFYDIQSHGVSHRNLSLLSDQDLLGELTQDQLNLKRCIGNLDTHQTIARHLAYPYGAVSHRVERIASRYFLSGFLYNNAPARLGQPSGAAFIRNGDHYRIPRLIVGEHESVNKLIRLANSSTTLPPS